MDDTVSGYLYRHISLIYLLVYLDISEHDVVKFFIFVYAMRYPNRSSISLAWRVMIALSSSDNLERLPALKSLIRDGVPSTLCTTNFLSPMERNGVVINAEEIGQGTGDGDGIASEFLVCQKLKSVQKLRVFNHNLV